VNVADLSFYVFVLGTVSIEKIRDIILNNLSTPVLDSVGDIEVEGNIIELEMNEEWEDGIENKADPLTWKFALQVFPIDKSRTLNDQINLARMILNVLREKGLYAQVGANFEKDL
jgi:hypothetical protein